MSLVDWIRLIIAERGRGQGSITEPLIHGAQESIAAGVTTVGDITTNPAGVAPGTNRCDALSRGDWLFTGTCRVGAQRACRPNRLRTTGTGRTGAGSEFRFAARHQPARSLHGFTEASGRTSLAGARAQSADGHARGRKPRGIATAPRRHRAISRTARRTKHVGCGSDPARQPAARLSTAASRRAARSGDSRQLSG